MSRNKDDKFISVSIPFLPIEWSSFPIGLYRKEVKNPSEAIQMSFERMARLLPSIKKSTKALVFNSGYGVAAIFIADKYGCKVECICNTDENTKLTSKLVEKLGLSDLITITTCTFDQVPYSGASFDLVWAMESLSFNEDKSTTLKEVARLLVPEGRFIFSDYTKPKSDLSDLWVNIESADRKRKLIASNDYIKLADRADLERVYVREDSDQLLEHLSYIGATVTAKLKGKQLASTQQRLDDLKKQVENKSLSWGIYQFQKRND